MKSISRVLVANRGEIAVRVIKACQALGIQTVAALSKADMDSLPAKMADKAICIGPERAGESYLKMDSIITTALGTGSDAIHPGYGFLSEQPELAECCAKFGLKFIGPRAETLKLMGDKIQARQMAKAYGIPVIPGSEQIRSFEEAQNVARELGFPVLLKAAAGGGGRGMRIVKNPAELKESFEMARNEARNGFGDETIFMERFIANARHIEVQIFADSFGKAVYIGERDCSLQRRYQKIIEEAPASAIADDLREEICRNAVIIAEKIGYENAGTVEFIVDQENNKFYFLEVNARIQVEHPVSEMVSGIDLVQEQIKVAAGHPLELTQSDIRIKGHAIECRINAEAAEKGFKPSPGRIKRWSIPQGPGIRVDSHCYEGYLVPPFYDSLLAKLIVVGADRREAIRKMQEALQEFVIDGIDTTIPFLKFIINHTDYFESKVHTKWVEEQIGDKFIITN